MYLVVAARMHGKRRLYGLGFSLMHHLQAKHEWPPSCAAVYFVFSFRPLIRPVLVIFSEVFCHSKSKQANLELWLSFKPMINSAPYLSAWVPANLSALEQKQFFAVREVISPSLLVVFLLPYSNSKY